MLRAENTVTIGKPVPEVFAFVTDGMNRGSGARACWTSSALPAPVAWGRGIAKA